MPVTYPFLLMLFNALVYVPFVKPEPVGLHEFSNLSYGSGGRLAIAAEGDIWMAQVDSAALLEKAGRQTPSIRWERLTDNPADDRDPVWRPDGRSLLFASDRAGNFDIWEIRLTDEGQFSEPRRLLGSAEDNTQPAVGADGTVVWVRGQGADANLWMLRDGEEMQLTEEVGEEYHPAISPDGFTLAYIARQDRKPKLYLRTLDGDEKNMIIDQLPAEYPAWSPDGQRIAFTTRGAKPGVWITNTQGDYTNLLSPKRAIPAWTADGQHLALWNLPRNPPSYNGDPDWARSRYLDGATPGRRELSFIPVPLPPGEGNVTLPFAEATGKEQWIGRLNRVVDQLNQRYHLEEGPFREEWQTLISAFRQKAEGVTSEEEMETLIYGLLRQRPLLRKEAKGRAGISSAHPLATAAGLEILKKGGNVVDAAIAVSFALGVVEPDASGIGGYGEMLVYLQGMEAPTCIEFLTRVPQAASLTNGALAPLPVSGPVLVNVPGTVAGMELAWKRYGSKQVSWADLLAPAIELAREGFVLDESFPATLQKEKEQYWKYESSRALFFPEGKTLRPGDTLRNPDLAWTLGQISDEGSKAFYKGRIAEKMVADLRSHGNVMTRRDLARYYAVERTPVTTTYRGHTVFSGPPPVSGGANLAGQLNLLEQLQNPAAYRDDLRTLHSMIEAWKLAPSTRGRVADPGLWPVDLTAFTDKALARQRWQSCYDPNQSTLPADSSCIDNGIAAAWGADKVLDARSSTGTTAFVVADADGNMVSVTQTLGTWGGNFYVSPGLGFLYNDKLRSYADDPDRHNARIPFARNVTSIAPTMVFKGTGNKKKPYLAVGAAGNAWITSAVYQIVAGVIDQGLGPQEAIEQPRFLVGVRRDPKNRETVREIIVQLEDGFRPGLLEQLSAMGHELQLISSRGELRMGYASAIVVDGKEVIAGADPRRSGEAGAVEYTRR